ncbi:MAG: hypothetical protein Q4G36_06225 [Paracoccus sp. (in: a-proteobacteria)]|nr:hypothetical protein [Paracoccus sp. (in: a-proteobacteria)]
MRATLVLNAGASSVEVALCGAADLSRLAFWAVASLYDSALRWRE